MSYKRHNRGLIAVAFGAGLFASLACPPDALIIVLSLALIILGITLIKTL